MPVYQREFGRSKDRIERHTADLMLCHSKLTSMPLPNSAGQDLLETLEMATYTTSLVVTYSP